MRVKIDLYSDTKTRPTAAMRQAIAEAEVGDEQHMEDPTVLKLVERCANLLGHEAAVFLPSGTMANEIAVLVHCRPGDEILAHRDSHILNFEGGAVAALTGAMVRPLDGPKGIFNAETLKKSIRPVARHLPRSRLVVVEQTTNLGGGAVWSLEKLDKIIEIARHHTLVAHMDGARLPNASVASKIPLSRMAGHFDSVFLDFTKGLGTPFGAVLAGSHSFIEEAWRWKQRLGGSMRQAGMMAQACLYALDHHIERLEEDHDRARLLSEGIASIDLLRVEPVETNMVFIDVSGTGLTAAEFNQQLIARDIRMSIQGDMRLRAVTHLDISPDHITETVAAVAAIAAGERK